MSEPTIPPPPPPMAPSPFQPEPIRPARSGCPKPLLIGCLVLLVLGGVAGIGGLYFLARNLDRVMLFYVDQLEAGVEAALPEDLPADERQRLDAAFVSARRAVQDSAKVPERAQQIQYELMDIARTTQDGKVTREEVRKITETLERIGGPGGGAPSGT